MESNSLEIEDAFLPSLEQGVAETSHQDRTRIWESDHLIRLEQDSGLMLKKLRGISPQGVDIILRAASVFGPDFKKSYDLLNQAGITYNFKMGLLMQYKDYKLSSLSRSAKNWLQVIRT